VVLLQQGGNNQHAHICESLELFSSSVMPAFKARHAAREATKQAELTPCIAAALARKPRRAAPADAEIPAIVALGKTLARQESTDGLSADFGRREIHVPLEDPLAARAGG
jgi:hypothetical protein